VSEQDVDLARRTFGTLAEEGYEALLPQIHPDFEMETLPGIAAEPQVYRGPEGVRRWWESFYEVMDEVRIEPTAYHDAGPGKVLIEAQLHARGQSSGLDVSQDTWLLCHLRDEQLTGIEFFTSRDEAMAAIGGDS
jgi:ketosteroid isomerase-like protein